MSIVEATADALFARVQIATLQHGRLPIPHNHSRIALEIGVSDRDTMDVELLPKWRDLFLVSAEPLVDKYARGLARKKHGKGDGFQPLGHHDDRGLILPLAVGNVGDEPQVRTLAVGYDNAGCSSLRELDKRSNRLKWCAKVGERRSVPVVSLRTLLSWIGPPTREIEIMKIGANCEVRV